MIYFYPVSRSVVFTLLSKSETVNYLAALRTCPNPATIYQPLQSYRQSMGHENEFMEKEAVWRKQNFLKVDLCCNLAVLSKSNTFSHP